MTLLAQFAATGGGVPQYIEDVFSTYLYTGNSPTGQSINNGIDLSTKGGLVWCKGRTIAAGHSLYDTTRGITKYLASNSTNADQPNGAGERLTSFNTNGFSLGTDPGSLINNSSYNYASWTFREQEKFFDVVTYTGNGSATNSIAHNLKSLPGFIVVKRTDSTSDWHVVARFSDTNYVGGGSTNSFSLNTTAIVNNGLTPTERGITTTAFDAAKMYGGVGSFDVSKTNVNGGTYVAYLFAHNAGGFGLTGSDNVISCGNYTCVAYPGDVTVTLGYEPQWVMVKNMSQASNWVIYDNMRGMPGTTAINPVTLAPDSSAAENGVTGSAPGISPTATGFIARAGLTAVSGTAGDNIIYIAIRRGPMKVPTTGTSVFDSAFGDGSAPCFNSTFPIDFAWMKRKTGGTSDWYVGSRLQGGERIEFNNTDAAIGDLGMAWNYQTAWRNDTQNADWVSSMFQRAPGFFDVVCYTGTGSARTVSHNLTVAPELLFVKARSNAQNWSALCTLSSGLQGRLNTTDALSAPSAAVWGSGGVYVAPTSSVFTVGTDNETNASTWTYVAYLFATCAGVSKVGSYTGTATTLQINCGFTAGARFVLIKRTDSTGDWYVWDSARGIIAGNDPYLLLNSTAAEVTGTDYVDTAATGFEITSTAPAAINANGGSYIFLAIA